MQNDDRQEELERKIAEAVALAQSVVEDNERESHAENGNTDSPEIEAVMTEPGGERKKLLWKVVLGGIIGGFAGVHLPDREICVCT